MRGKVAAGLAVMALVGCGGRSEIGGTGGVIGAVSAGGGDDQSDSGDDANDVDFGVCPGLPPTPGQACNPAGQICAYPNDGHACFECDAYGVWTASQLCP